MGLSIIKRFAIAVVAAGTLQIGTGLCQSIRIPDFRQSPVEVANMPEGPCDECGVIRSIREIHRGGDSSLYRTSSIGSSSSNDQVIGAVIFVIPIGPGSADAKPFVGGVGTQSMQERLGELSYEIAVRMRDGTLRTYERREGRQYSIGDQVRITQDRWEVFAPGR